MAALSLSDIRKVNQEFRASDESHLWPINGQFNVTNRCIQRLRYLQNQGLIFDDITAYRETLELLISRVVNAPHAIDDAGRIRWHIIDC